MNIDLRFGISTMLVFIIFIFGCTVSNKSYVLNDRSYRNIKIEFKRDSTFSLENRVQDLSLLFQRSGKWRKINKSTVVLFNPSCINLDCDTTNRSVKIFEHTDYELLKKLGSNYIFPIIIIDTARVFKKSLRLKGFVFKESR